MKITIEVHTATYAAWEEGADERERTDERTDSHSFDNARECADWLEGEGFGSPSADPGPYDRRTWLSELKPYEDPYTGVLTERSAHVEGDGPDFNSRLWAAIVASVSRRWTHYVGPYYVERVNVFGVKL
jgi:hypothetical protein